MKVFFKDKALEELYSTGKTKDRKYKNICKSTLLVRGYIRIVGNMYNADSVEDLKTLSFLHYEKLRHQKGESRSSVRLANGKVERLIFTESQEGIEVELIEIDNTHYGNKK